MVKIGNIITNGLVGYWHYKQGVESEILSDTPYRWFDINPNAENQYYGNVSGATLQQDGLYFDGIDDYAVLSFPIGEIFDNKDSTIEISVDLEMVGYPQPIFAESFVTNTTSVYWMDNDNEIMINIGNKSGYTSSYIFDYYGGKINLAITYAKDERAVKYYIDGVLAYIDNSQSIDHEFSMFNKDIKLLSIGSPFVTIKGKFIFLRFYNKALTEQEVAQNYLVGDEIGLEDDEDSPIESPPIVNVISAKRTKLSNQPNMDKSNILFRFGFDQDVIEWRAVLLGSSHDTGTIVDSGGFVERGGEVTTEVDWQQLYGEGENRINFYGKNENGEWTPYNDDRFIM